MQTKRKITAVTAQRYRTADRKGKTTTLDEFTATAGYNRKYALHILANRDRTRLTRVKGKTVKFKAAKRKRKPGGGRPKVYTGQTIAVLEKIGVFEGYPCGKILAQILRNQLRVFIEDEYFGPMLTPEIAAAPAAISPRHIERRLVEARKKLQLKGTSTAKRGNWSKTRFPSARISPGTNGNPAFSS